MTGYAGKDLLLKIGDGGSPQAFLTLGAARATVFDIANDAADATPLGAAVPVYSAAAGRRDSRIALQGLFKDSAAEERLRSVANSGAVCDYKLVFPNGDVYAAALVVDSYRREGSHDGQESFSATFRRSGAGVWTLA